MVYSTVNGPMIYEINIEDSKLVTETINLLGKCLLR